MALCKCRNFKFLLTLKYEICMCVIWNMKINVEHTYAAGSSSNSTAPRECQAFFQLHSRLTGCKGPCGTATVPRSLSAPDNTSTSHLPHLSLPHPHQHQHQHQHSASAFAFACKSKQFAHISCLANCFQVKFCNWQAAITEESNVNHFPVSLANIRYYFTWISMKLSVWNRVEL